MAVSGQDIGRIITNIVDGVLFGIPSTVLLDQIRQDYQMDYDDASRMINEIQHTINDQQIQLEDFEENKSRVLNQIYSYSPMGELRTSLEQKYNDISARASKVRSDLKMKEDELVKAQAKLNEAAVNMSKSLGQEAKERVFDA